MALSKIKKFEDLDFSQWVAVGNKLGGVKNVVGLLGGNLTVEVKKNTRSFFDKNGRRIPEGLKFNICDPDRNFKLEQPQLIQEVDYARRLDSLRGVFIDTNVDFGNITAEQFKRETEILISKIQNDSLSRNSLRGNYLPVILPWIDDNLEDIIRQFLRATAKSYAKNFPERKFNNFAEGKLEGISIVPESRHDKLVGKMHQEAVVGIYFPSSLHGFSIKADREQMATLPENFILSGLDAIIGMIMYPDILSREWYTLGIDLAAFSLPFIGDGSLCFRTFTDILVADGHTVGGSASNACSGGLFFYR